MNFHYLSAWYILQGRTTEKHSIMFEIISEHTFSVLIGRSALNKKETKKKKLLPYSVF